MTVVGGEPVEVQVRVKGEALPLNSKLVTCGVSVGVQMCSCMYTLFEVPN